MSGSMMGGQRESEQLHEMGQRFVEQQEELADLKEENEYLRNRLAVGDVNPSTTACGVLAPWHARHSEFSGCIGAAQDDGMQVDDVRMGADTHQHEGDRFRGQQAPYQTGAIPTASAGFTGKPTTAGVSGEASVDIANI
jgi:hypothetical protein